MKINNALLRVTKILKLKQIDSPRLDAEILLAFTLKKPREFLLAHPNQELKKIEISKYQNFINRRARRQPIAYITHTKEFYGLEFIINKNVLIPRPETELLVDEVLKYFCTIAHDRKLLYKRKAAIIDVGTGSGCVAITIAKKHRNIETRKQGNNEARKQGSKETRVEIFAVDSSLEALKIAQKNAKLHGVSNQIKFLRGDLLQPIKSQILQLMRSHQLEKLIFTANLPYLTMAEWKKTQPEIRKYEPRKALVGGTNGLKYYKLLLMEINDLLPCLSYPSPRGKIAEGVSSLTCFLEINPQQKNPLRRIVKNYFPGAKTNFIQDLSGSIRVCKIEIFNFNQNKNV